MKAAVIRTRADPSKAVFRWFGLALGMAVAVAIASLVFFTLAHGGLS